MKQEKPIKISDAVAIGEWKEVKGLEQSAITHNPTDTEKLDGMLIYGYETKFGKTNTNGERYTKDCLDKFINEYFVENKLNIPVTIQHWGNMAALCGRVIYCEVNTTGFYFVCYIPKALPEYEGIKVRVQEGILQGLSKEGYCTDAEWMEKGDEEFWQINEMMLLGISLVATPANAVTFEKATEIKNKTEFRNKCGEGKKKTKKKNNSGTLSAMFQK